MNTLLARGRPRRRRIFRGLLYTAGAGSILLLILYVALMLGSRITPPPLTAGTQPPLEVRGERAYVGPSYMTRERGLWELHLEGEPFPMGYAHTRLANRLIMDTDVYMFREFERYVPSWTARFLIMLGVRWRYRNLARSIPEPRLEEIAGQASGYFDLYHYGDFLPTFHRMVFYHALHDITQSLEHSPLLGCSAFAASGVATTNGHLLIGRNFDFEGPEPFDRDKAVLFFKPVGKIPFASVAWPGMTGVVTGMNAKGIYVSVNAARTDDKGKDGIPVEILLREVLENATSINEAAAIVKANPIMVPDFYLVGDGKTGESAVIERSPTRMEVRRSHDTIALTNHALTSAFAADSENDRLRRYLTSGARYRRLAELLKQHRGGIDVRRVLDILRDKNGDGGAPLGLGNRNALDAIIATHSVVVDATNMMLWVSSGPHLIGRYVGFDLRRELLGEDRPEPPDLPEDPLAGSAELRDYRQAMDELRTAERLARTNPDLAIEAAEKAAALSERTPEPHRLLGDLLRPRDRERARSEYQRFLDLHPPYLHDVEDVKGILSSF